DGAGEIERYLLPNVTSKYSIPIGSSDIVNDIQVAPGAPHTIAVSLKNSGTIGPGAAVYDDATQRSNIIAPGSEFLGSLQWGASNSVLYGADTMGYSDSLWILGADSNGLTISNTINGAFFDGGGKLFYDSATDLIYAQDGSVLDSSGNPVGRLPINGPTVLDVTNNKAFDVEDTSVHSRVYLAINSYDLSTMAKTGTVYIPYVGSPLKIIRYGSDGIAVIATGNNSGGNSIYLISGQFVN
ncbi:MAG: hypothetical protein ACRESU_02030, partial [Gammaproteobacteria bacterium]